jgi:hypothetical protein
VVKEIVDEQSAVVEISQRRHSGPLSTLSADFSEVRTRIVQDGVELSAKAFDST